MTQKPAPFILCLAFALACGAELPAPAGELEELTKRHTAALSRDGAPGYPRGWSLRPCTFVDELLRPGAGTSAATCQALEARGAQRGLPDHVHALAQQRFGEALGALTRAEDALQLYAFGGDLQRLGEAELWALGVEAQARALDALEARDEGGWSRSLQALVEAAPPPTRVADALLLDRLASGERVTVSELKKLEKASIYASNAAHTKGVEREENMAGFAAAWPWPIDAGEAWRRAEAQRSRALAMATGR